MQDCFCGSVAQHRVRAREVGVRNHGRTTTQGFESNWEVGAAFVTTRANSQTFFSFYGFYGFLRTINLRSRLTILSNLNSVGR